MPALKNVKCRERYIVNDIGQAIDETENLRAILNSYSSDPKRLDRSGLR